MLVFLVACGPGPTEPNTPQPTPTSTSTTTITPTKPVTFGPDCKMKAVEKLAATVTDAGMHGDASAERQEEVNPPDGAAVLQKLAPKLQACNATELEGCAYLTTTVETDGTVSAAELFVSDALPRDVVACLAGVLKDARFAPLPKAGKMQVPVTFTRTR